MTRMQRYNLRASSSAIVCMSMRACAVYACMRAYLLRNQGRVQVGPGGVGGGEAHVGWGTQTLAEGLRLQGVHRVRPGAGERPRLQSWHLAFHRSARPP